MQHLCLFYFCLCKHCVYFQVSLRQTILLVSVEVYPVSTILRVFEFPFSNGTNVIRSTRTGTNFREMFRNFPECFYAFATFSKFSEVFGPMRMRLDMLECIRTHSDPFGSVWTCSTKFGIWVFRFYLTIYLSIYCSFCCYAADKNLRR